MAIFISDGVPWPSYRRNPALQEAEALKSSGSSVIAIGVTNVIDRDLLRAISSPPQTQGQNFFVATNFTVLSEIRKSVGEGTCQVVQGSKVKVYHQWQPILILINQRMLHESLFTSQLSMTTNVYLCVFTVKLSNCFAQSSELHEANYQWLDRRGFFGYMRSIHWFAFSISVDSCFCNQECTAHSVRMYKLIQQTLLHGPYLMLSYFLHVLFYFKVQCKLLYKENYAFFSLS